MKPLLSIITTSLNRRELLRKTFESVLAQNYERIEQIGIDAASTDGTADLFREYEKKFHGRGFAFRYVSEPDSGQGEAMNKGLRMATGDFVMILNSDDILYDDSVNTFMETLMVRSDVDVLYGDHESFYEDGRKEVIRHKLYTWNDVIRRGYQVPQSSAIIKRSFVERVSGFDESLHHVAEHDFFLRLMKAGAKFFYTPVILQSTLEHSGRKTTFYGTRAWRETKKVNFRHGGGRLSAFYALYLKNVYFGRLWGFVKKKFPRIYASLKGVFYRKFR